MTFDDVIFDRLAQHTDLFGMFVDPFQSGLEDALGTGLHREHLPAKQLFIMQFLSVSSPGILSALGLVGVVVGICLVGSAG